MIAFNGMPLGELEKTLQRLQEVINRERLAVAREAGYAIIKWNEGVSLLCQTPFGELSIIVVRPDDVRVKLSGDHMEFLEEDLQPSIHYDLFTLRHDLSSNVQRCTFKGEMAIAVMRACESRRESIGKLIATLVHTE